MVWESWDDDWRKQNPDNSDDFIRPSLIAHRVIYFAMYVHNKFCIILE